MSSRALLDKRSPEYPRLIRDDKRNVSNMGWLVIALGCAVVLI